MALRLLKRSMAEMVDGFYRGLDVLGDVLAEWVVPAGLGAGLALLCVAPVILVVVAVTR